MTRYHIEYDANLDDPDDNPEWRITVGASYPLQEEPYRPYPEAWSWLIMMTFEAESLVDAVRIAEEKVTKFIEGKNDVSL